MHQVYCLNNLYFKVKSNLFLTRMCKLICNREYVNYLHTGMQDSLHTLQNIGPTVYPSHWLYKCFWRQGAQVMYSCIPPLLSLHFLLTFVFFIYFFLVHGPFHPFSLICSFSSHWYDGHLQLSISIPHLELSVSPVKHSTLCRGREITGDQNTLHSVELTRFHVNSVYYSPLTRYL